MDMLAQVAQQLTSSQDLMQNFLLFWTPLKTNRFSCVKEEQQNAVSIVKRAI